MNLGLSEWMKEEFQPGRKNHKVKERNAERAVAQCAALIKIQLQLKENVELSCTILKFICLICGSGLEVLMTLLKFHFPSPQSTSSFLFFFASSLFANILCLG